MIVESRSGRRIIGRLNRGDVLPKALLDVAQTHNVRAGAIVALGALENVVVGEFDQDTLEYTPPLEHNAPCELLNLTGNFSLRDGELFLHAHVTCSYEQGGNQERVFRLIGGHLWEARVFSLEFVIDTADDVELLRKPDGETRLALWSK